MTISADKFQIIEKKRNGQLIFKEQDSDFHCQPVDRSTPHPTGVTLTRPGYYTIPALDDMVELMDENGNCYVEDLTVGRENYGNVFFPGITNVAGMNLDDIGNKKGA